MDFYDFGVGDVQRFPHTGEASPVVTGALAPVVEDTVDDPASSVEELTQHS